MIHIDFMSDVVAMEALDQADAEDVLAVFNTASSSQGACFITRKDDASGEWVDVPITVGARSSGGVSFRERHVSQTGEYRIISWTRQGKGPRGFHLRLDSFGKGKLRVTIYPDSARCTWIIADYDPVKSDGKQVIVDLDDYQIASIDTGDDSTQRRPTAWEQLGDDDF